MKSPITKLAVAATVIVACLIGLSLWRNTGSGIALADVLARVEQVKAFRYKSLLKIYGDEAPDKSVTEVHTTQLMSEYGWKTNFEELDPNGGESTFVEIYFLPQKKTEIRIWPNQKEYWRRENLDWEVERTQDLNDPRWWLKCILRCKYESMGRSTIDGIEAEGFRTTDADNYNSGTYSQVDAKMWVDVKTWLPVRWQVEAFDQDGDKMHWRIVDDDFQWDVPVDAAEFEPVIPDDYTRIAGIPVSMTVDTEENAIKGLKLYADLSGNYPVKPNWGPNYKWSTFEKSETPAARRLQEELKGLTKEDRPNRITDALMPIEELCYFYAGVYFTDKDPAYYGKTVTPKDTDKVLLRWKLSDTEYRVIFGDLRAETVSPEKLAELEKALPQ